MPKLLEKLPKYRKHSGRNVAFVVLGGRRVYLKGSFGSSESKAEYKARILEWETSGRTATPPTAHQNELTLKELLAQFVIWGQTYYGDSGELENVAHALRPVNELYGNATAREFGPLALKAVRERMIRDGLSRNVINDRISRVKRVFRWLTENELIPPSVYHGLQAVRGLSAGRSGAKETEPVKPVREAFVDAVKPFVNRQVWAMIELQRWTGMRSGEVTAMRTADLDTSGKVWVYSPAKHKTAHHGHRRQIYIGPRAQAVLKPWLRTNLAEFLFSPREAMEEWRSERSRQRKTPLSCGNRPGTNRKRNPQKPLSDCYDTMSYYNSVRRACERAKVPHWHPHQLRHNAATWLRKEYGLDVARCVLGHRSPQVTETYAELDFAKAAEIMGKVG